MRRRRDRLRGPLRDPVTGERVPLRYAAVSRWPPARLKDPICALGLDQETTEFLGLLYMTAMIEHRWPTVEEMCRAKEWPPARVEAMISSLLRRGFLGRGRSGTVYLLDLLRLEAAVERERGKMAKAR